MKRYLQYLSAVMVFILVILAVHCAVNPVTGKKEIMLVSESMEINMGREIDQGLKMEYGMYDDPGLRDYITEVGERMVPHTHRPQLQYHFAVLDTPVENAFAAPGGYIYITRGLLALMNSEAELATVIGHELGHVNARHSARQITRSILFTLGIVIFSEISKDFRKIAPLTMIATELLFLKYSRSDEYQADELGFQYAMKAGYNSTEMVTFFSTLDRMTISEGGARIPNFLSTHPMTPKRIEKIKQMIQTEDLSNPNYLAKLKVDRTDYLNSLNGLIYGDNPRQGFIEGNAFYHPDMRFYLMIPRGWQVNNTPRQVTMQSKDGKAILLLQAEESPEALDSYSKKMAKNLTEPKLLSQDYKYINGLDAFHSIFQMTPKEDTASQDTTQKKEKEKIDVNITCIRKENMIYSFFTATGENDYRAYSSDIYYVINSFKPLNNQKYLGRKPLRLYVRQVNAQQSLEQYLNFLRVPRQLWDKISLMNSMQLSQQVSVGQNIKIIQ